MIAELHDIRIFSSLFKLLRLGMLSRRMEKSNTVLSELIVDNLYALFINLTYKIFSVTVILFYFLSTMLMMCNKYSHDEMRNLRKNSKW